MLKQTVANMRVNRLDPEVPYFFRIMVHKGTASDGNIVIRMGSISVTTAVSGLSSGWNEITTNPDTTAANQKKHWFRQFNQDPMDVEIEWSGASGTNSLYIDDAIFCQWDKIDGTYWVIRGANASHASWLVDDTLEFTDTGGAPATGKIQWWNFISGLGYLPHTTGTPTLSEPY